MESDSNHSNSEIEKRLQAIYALHIKKMDFRLEEGPYQNLLTALGHPHHHLPPVIHVAGTNGKGSTIAFLKSIFEAHGLSVHCYTSPHLVQFNERIVLNGKPIADDDLLAYLTLIDQVNDGAPVTFFEYTTALAFRAMADHPADICLLETGLGGRLDCTNVVENPALTIITAIGYDHMDWLGDDIQTIAAEKAGIMKPNVPCVIAPQHYAEQVHPVFQLKAEQVGCDLAFVERIKDLPDLGLIGDHQQDNASTALNALDMISLPHVIFNQANIAKGLRQVQWSARMEHLSSTPDIWFDCGHNADGAMTIAAQLKLWKVENPDRAIHLILGLAGDKDPNDFMAPLWDYCDHVTCIDLPNARNPQMAVDLMGKIHVPDGQSISSAVDIARALAMATSANTADKKMTLITGSLYLYEQAIWSI